MGYKDHLYTVEGADQKLDASLETIVFSPLDSRANDAVEFMLANPGKSLSTDLRNAFTHLLLSFLHRTPDRLDDLKNRLLAGVEPLIEGVRQRHEAGENVELPSGVSLEDAIVHIRRQTRTRSWGSLLIDLLNSQGIGPHILNMLWFVREIRHTDNHFLTGDKPLVHYNGIGQKDGNIALALSPTFLFIATNNIETAHNASWVSDSFLVKRFNHEVARLAVDYVYSDSTSQRVFVEARLKNPTPPSVPILQKRIQPQRQWFIR